MLDDFVFGVSEMCCAALNGQLLCGIDGIYLCAVVADTLAVLIANGVGAAECVGQVVGCLEDRDLDRVGRVVHVRALSVEVSNLIYEDRIIYDTSLRV